MDSDSNEEAINGGSGDVDDDDAEDEEEEEEEEEEEDVGPKANGCATSRTG